jgi:hypothetical protein
VRSRSRRLQRSERRQKHIVDLNARTACLRVHFRRYDLRAPFSSAEVHNAHHLFSGQILGVVSIVSRSDGRICAESQARGILGRNLWPHLPCGSTAMRRMRPSPASRRFQRRSETSSLLKMRCPIRAGEGDRSSFRKTSLIPTAGPMPLIRCSRTKARFDPLCLPMALELEIPAGHLRGPRQPVRAGVPKPRCLSPAISTPYHKRSPQSAIHRC